MPANTVPIYTDKPDNSFDNGTGMAQPITLVANDFTGIGANNRLLFTAGPNGGYLRGFMLKASGANAATVLRIFLNNGALVGTATNNAFIKEISLPATAANATFGSADIFVPFEFAMKAATRIYGGLGTAVAAGWTVTPIGGQY